MSKVIERHTEDQLGNNDPHYTNLSAYRRDYLKENVDEGFRLFSNQYSIKVPTGFSRIKNKIFKNDYIICITGFMSLVTVCVCVCVCVCVRGRARSIFVSYFVFTPCKKTETTFMPHYVS